MFKTTVGPVDTGDGSNVVYLRPETAQGIFVNFGNVLDTMRRKLPFASPRSAKPSATRSPRAISRSEPRVRADGDRVLRSTRDDEAAHQMWIDTRQAWYKKLGMRPRRFARASRRRRACHYAKRCVDLEYHFPMGWSELEGIANRTDFDLKAHSRSEKNPTRSDSFRSSIPSRKSRSSPT